MRRMFRLCNESLTVVDWISLLIIEQVLLLSDICALFKYLDPI
jgi:hypothetical protein